MTIDQWYFEFDGKAQEILTRLKKYLEEANSAGRRSVLTVEKFDTGENSLHFNYGQRKLIFSYSIHLKDFECHFETKELVMNEDNYGTYRVKALPELEIILDSYDKMRFVAKKEQEVNFHGDHRKFITARIDNFPKDYLNQIRNEFQTI